MKTAPLYIVLDETSIDGTYATPEDAARAAVPLADDGFIYLADDASSINPKISKLTVEQAAKEMMKPNRWYPVIQKLEAGKPFSMDR